MIFYRSVILFLILIIKLQAYPQDIQGNIIYRDEDYSGLNTVLKGKSIIMLGEQTHGDGATFDEKVKLIKYLHETLGFNSIVFESGLYDNYKASLLAKENKSLSIINQSVISLWSGQQMFEDLINYIEERAKEGDYIKIMGFDNQEGSLFENYFIEDLKSTFGKYNISISDKTVEALEKSLISRDLDNIASSREDSLVLYAHFDFLKNAFKEIKNPDVHVKILNQVVLSKIADVDYQIKDIQGQKIYLQNPRDQQMFENLYFLSRLYPDEKFICWGASYHFAGSLESIDNDLITTEFINKQIEAEKQIVGHIESDIGEIAQLSKAIPMGELAKQKLNGKIFTVAFSSYTGSYKGIHDKNFPILTPPKGSIEQRLSDLNYNKVCIDLTIAGEEKFYCSALGNIPLKGRWGRIFDALIFVKNSYPPTPRTYTATELRAIELSKNSNLVIRGQVFDEGNNPITTYSDVYLLNSGKSAVSNNIGQFSLNLTPKEIKERVIVSSFGYLPDTLSISDKEFYKVVLKKDTSQHILMDEIVIEAQGKAKTSEEIIKNARKSIKVNYFQQPYNQDFFYRTRIKRASEIIYNEEASISTFNSSGLSGSNNVSGNFFGNIQEFRNTTHNINPDKWSGVGNLWTLLERNLVLSKANVLYRTSSYSCAPPEIIRYNNKDVYKISFSNNSPGAHSTGYGYPSPISSSGSIYIDKDTYAVYRYEHCVIRKERENKRIPNKKFQVTHHIIETYKEVNNKYFVNFSSEITKEKVLSKITGQLLYENYYTNTLMSQNIETVNVVKITRPIDLIKDNVNLAEYKEYWENAHSFIEDDIMDVIDCN